MVQIAVGLVTTLSVFAGNEIRVDNTQLSSPQDSIAAKKEVSPQEYLRNLAGPDFDLLNRIVIAESGWHIDAKNPSSTASGLFQFLDSTFSSYCIDKYQLTDNLVNKNDPYIQIKCAVLMIQAGGLNHWNASKHLWEQKQVIPPRHLD